MSIRFDEKGKFFTDIISKNSIPVIIQTTAGRVQGRLHIRPSERFKDELNRMEKFVAITEAKIFEGSGDLSYECEFFCVHRDQIVWMLPESEIIDPGERSNEGEK